MTRKSETKGDSMVNRQPHEPPLEFEQEQNASSEANPSDNASGQTQPQPASPMHQAAWPDMFANLQTAYAELTQARSELEHRITEVDEIRDLFERVIESMSEMLFLVDVTGRVLQLNQAASTLLGQAKSALVGRPLSEIFSTTAIPATPQELLSHSAKGMLSDLEIDVHTEANKIVPLSVSCALVRDTRSKITGILIVARDITERKRTEERFRIAVEAAPNAMIMVDQQGIIVLVNSQTESLFGYTRDELVGHHMEFLIPERYRQSHPAYRANFYNNPQVRPMGAGRDLYGQRKDGQEVAIEIGLTPLTTDEGAFVLASIINITERKRIEEQNALLREKDILLKEIHHRVKNNLQLVSSMLKLQSSYIDNPKTLDYFQESENRIRSIAMIHEKLYQSKSLAEVDFAEYVGDLVSMLFHTYSTPDSVITLQTEITPMLVDIDMAIPIGLILNELLTNSLKHAFTNSRSGTVTITMTSALNKQFTLTIADNGIGFPENLILENTTTLGLRLVKILAKQLKAEVIFQTGQDGTTFTFIFPNTK